MTQKPAIKGLRYNKGKPQVSLIDSYTMIELAKVLTKGAEKYAPHNWRKGLKISECLDSLQRHYLAYNDANQADVDPETQLSHMAHIMCNAMFIMWLQKNMPTCDDRWVPTLGRKNRIPSAEEMEQGLKDKNKYKRKGK